MSLWAVDGRAYPRWKSGSMRPSVLGGGTSALKKFIICITQLKSFRFTDTFFRMYMFCEGCCSVRGKAGEEGRGNIVHSHPELHVSVQFLSFPR